MLHDTSAMDILIVEDNEDDFEAMERALKLEPGFNNTVHHCSDGEQAWAFLTRSGKFAQADRQAHMPGLILLDLNMPGLDGRKLLSRIKDDEDLCRIPVVILTTSSAERDVDACYDAGANSFVQKPLSWVAFTEAVRNLRAFWLKTAILPKLDKL